MIPDIRKKYNAEFTPEKYRVFLNDLGGVYPGALDFRVAETPVFVPEYFKNKMLSACESIVDLITDAGFKKLTEKAVPPPLNVPGENDHPHFICFDFGICENEAGEYEPQLIEMQGFPSLFCYQLLFPEIHNRHFSHPPGFGIYPGNLNKTTYLDCLKEIIIGGENPEQVILLELFPEKQKTRIDFFCTEEYLGIKPICLTRLEKDGNKLFYRNHGRKIEIRRIFNRLIFDELLQQPPHIREQGKLLFEERDVTWLPHPNWFYRISKYTLPFIRHPFVPETHFLHELNIFPSDPENFVLKPLFSFAGQGVIIDVTADELSKVKDPENWILQRKVKYADVILTPDVPAKAEIRIFYFWKNGETRPVAANNLARLSKGKMIGVRFNKDKEWVGGSFCLFASPGQ